MAHDKQWKRLDVTSFVANFGNGVPTVGTTELVITMDLDIEVGPFIRVG